MAHFNLDLDLDKSQAVGQVVRELELRHRHLDIQSVAELILPSRIEIPQSRIDFKTFRLKNILQRFH